MSQGKPSLSHSVQHGVFEMLARFRGSVSAEHGIGLLKKADLFYSRNRLEIAIMKDIKTLLDPNNIMNPGKIFDVD